MKEFRVRVDGRFLAENIDDALAKLGQHFTAAAAGLDEPSIFLPTSEIHIEPVTSERMNGGA